MEWKTRHRKTWKVINFIISSIMYFLWILMLILLIISVNTLINGVITSNLFVILFNLIQLLIILIPFINITIYLFIKPIRTFNDRRFSEEFVLYKGKKYYIENNSLSINSKYKINSIHEIERLELFIDTLEKLSLCNNIITKIEGLEQFKKLNSLNLSHNLIEKIEGLDNLEQLEELCLSNNSIRQISGLEKLSKLRILALKNNYIKKIENIEDCKSVEMLNLRHNYLTELSGIKNLISLVSLDVAYNKIEKVSGLETLLNLTFFNIWRNPLLEDPLRPKIQLGQRWVKYCQLNKGPKIILELQNLPENSFKKGVLSKRISWLENHFNNVKFMEKRLKKRDNKKISTHHSVKIETSSFFIFLKHQIKKDIKNPFTQILLVIIIIFVIIHWVINLIALILYMAVGGLSSMSELRSFQFYSIFIIMLIVFMIIMYYIRYKAVNKKEKKKEISIESAIRIEGLSFFNFLKIQFKTDYKDRSLQFLFVLIISLIFIPWFLSINVIIQNITAGGSFSESNMQFFQNYSIWLIIFIFSIILIYYLKFKIGKKKEKLTSQI